MKRIATLLVVISACGGKYKAPTPVPSVALPSGAALKPYDASKPGLARPQAMAQLGSTVYVTLANQRSDYSIGGPGLLGAFVPSAGTVSVIDLGGTDGQLCKDPGFVHAASGKLYASCGGSYADSSGEGLVEVDPATAKVTRSLKVTFSPGGFAVAPTRIWLGDQGSGNLVAVDRTTFLQAGDPVSLHCPTTGSYQTVADVIAVGSDLYALCSNSTGSVLNQLDAATGAFKSSVAAGPIAVELAATGDGRIAVLNSGDNTLTLVTPGTTLAAAVGYTFNAQTSTLQDVRALDQFLFTVASGSNTVQKIDLSAKGGPKLVAEANVGAGANPWNILPLDDDQAIVTNQLANTITAVTWTAVP